MANQYTNTPDFSDTTFLIDLTGHTFGRWLVLKCVGRIKGNAIKWLCRCECGTEKAIHGSSLQRGNSRSCGCLRKDVLRTHGLSRTPYHQSWHAMKRRCLDPTDEHFKWYGEKGITVCARWIEGDGNLTGLECFAQDLGERPPNTTLDRIDNTGNYEPSNCKWSTIQEQNNNKSTNHLISFNGKIQTVAQWSRELGCSTSLLYNRLRRGWTVERALSTV